MSVVVRMEMPKDCFECPFGIIDDTEDGVWCNALAQQSSGQREDCPIICSLPEGHGRLVDADSMEKEVCGGCVHGEHKYANCIDCALANAPTIVPAERSEK